MSKLTKKYVESLTPKDTSYIVWDSQVKGFGVRVSPKGKKVYLIKYVGEDKKQRKPVVGEHGFMTAEEARVEALDLLSKAKKGNDPQSEKEKQKAIPTLNQFFEMYIERHAKQHKKTWKFNVEYYNRHLRDAFGDKQITNITQTEVAKLHKRIGENSGRSMANQIITLLGMIFNKAVDWEYYEGRIPTQHIKKFKEKARDRFLQSYELPLFLDALNQEESVFRDFFYILLLTGQRKTNVLTMKWKDINLKEGYWRIPETKNGEPLVVPLVQDAIEILKERKIESKNLIWVFESETSESGHIIDPKKAWARIRKRSGIEDLNMHDLRRTMGSYQTIQGSSSFIVAKSLGHKSIKSTEIYARLNIDPVRQSMENATSFILNGGNKGDD